MSKLPVHNPCPCGSGKKYGQCCGHFGGCQVIHFPRGKRSNYRTLIETALGELLDYARKYYASWEEPALAKFASYTQLGEISDKFMPLFWEWYVLNCRYYKDVSPLIDFFLLEQEDILSDSYRSIYESLQSSYLSVHQVCWIRNNTVATRDIFTGTENIIERDFGSVTQFIEEGTLLLTRIININNVSIITGRPIIVYAEQKSYIYDEMNSVKICEGIDDFETFLREHGEIACGLTIDLINGIKKNRVKIRTLALSNLDRKVLIEQVVNSKYFSLLDRKERWLIFTWPEGKGLFKRVYFGDEAVIVAAEENEDVSLAVQFLNTICENCLEYKDLIWTDDFFYLDEEGTEEIQMEILNDRYLEEWLSLPHPELGGLKAVEAMQDIRGRVLLENLLNDLEMQEIRAKSRGEYYSPTSVIRKKLGLDRDKVYKELLFPPAIAIQVEKHRSRQQLSSYITAYNWQHEAYGRVAVTIFDMYTGNDWDKYHLAWLLYMWNEFTIVYRPRVSKDLCWIAALEHTLSICLGKNTGYGKIARYFGLSTSLVSRHSYLMARHFKNFPLDFRYELSTYPSWENMDFYEMIQSYEEVLQHLNLFTYSINPAWNLRKDGIYEGFCDEADLQGNAWDQNSKKIYKKFVHDHYRLDFNYAGNTIMKLFWGNQASRFPPYLRTAAYNLMMSYVGAYKIIPCGTNSLVFEDIFTGQKTKVYGKFSDNVHKDIVPGMIGICRLLPLGENSWVNEPMFIVLEDIEKYFSKYLNVYMEDLPLNNSNKKYLKQRGESIIKAYIRAVNDFEKTTLGQINQPLEFDWKCAYILDQKPVQDLLKERKYFHLLHEDENRTSFLWMRHCNHSSYQWGYLLISYNKAYLFIPPGKDMEKFIKDIRWSFKCADIVPAFGFYESASKTQKLMENHVLGDLAAYFKKNFALSCELLKYDHLDDENMELMQEIFLFKLTRRLIDYLEKKTEK